jgi:DNA-binding MarR family transcriptional regulator
MINQKIIDATRNYIRAGVLEKILTSKTGTWQQSEIAREMYLTRLTVNNHLKKLKEQGYINYKTSQYNGKWTTKFILLDKSIQLKKEIEKENTTTRTTNVNSTHSHVKVNAVPIKGTSEQIKPRLTQEEIAALIVQREKERVSRLKEVVQ